MPRLRKRSILLSGHATSMALESEFWAVLDEMALVRGVSLAGRGAGRGLRGGEVISSPVVLVPVAHSAS